MILWAAAALLAAQPLPSTGLDAPYDRSNVFARILRGEIPASKVCEDRWVLAFIPIDWDSPGEVLVIPKAPARNLLAITPSELTHVMVAVQHAAIAQRKALGSTGFEVVQYNGATSLQGVFHAHFHVIPSFGRAPEKSDYRTNVPRAEMDAIAARIRAAWPKSGEC